jgi:hypothetical protein
MAGLEPGNATTGGDVDRMEVPECRTQEVWRRRRGGPGMSEAALSIHARIPPRYRAQRHRQRLPSGDDPRALPRACAASVTPGNSRRSSTAADNSPPRSKAVRIAAASASETTNMLAGWERTSTAASARSRLPPDTRMATARLSSRRVASRVDTVRHAGESIAYGGCH